MPRLGLVSAVGGWLTIHDSFGTPGDTVCVATIARQIKARYPKLKINCITPNPALLELDPAIDCLNGSPTSIVLRYWYLDIIESKDGSTNLLAPTLRQVGIYKYTYQSMFFLSVHELRKGRERVSHLQKPIITINVQSREKVKVWPPVKWLDLVSELIPEYDVVQLGGDDEPELPGVIRLAGALSMRESAAVLAQAKLHIGGVSFLMHVANGLNVPSVIIYGGRETPANSGYASNTNLYVKLECSPCWLHDSHGDVCPFSMACMEQISVSQVEDAARRYLKALPDNQLPLAT